MLYVCLRNAAILFFAPFFLAMPAFAERDFVMMYQLTKYNQSWPQLEPMVFNRIIYQPSFGLKPRQASSGLFAKGAAKPMAEPSQKSVEKGLRRYQLYGDEVLPEYTVLDIEVWKTGLSVDEDSARKSLSKYKNFIEKVRERRPNSRLGYYGLPVYRDVTASLSGRGSKKYKAWQERNDLHKPLAESLDVFYVSLYTFDRNKADWETYAREHISESRRLAENEQPVIVFLWPEYHERSKLAGQRIEPEFWRLQLQTAFDYADGVFIWDNTYVPFSDLSWVNETQSFVSHLQSMEGVSINAGLARHLEKYSCQNAVDF